MRISDWSSDVCSSDLRRPSPSARTARWATNGVSSHPSSNRPWTESPHTLFHRLGVRSDAEIFPRHPSRAPDRFQHLGRLALLIGIGPEVGSQHRMGDPFLARHAHVIAFGVGERTRTVLGQSRIPEYTLWVLAPHPPP